MNLKFIQMLIQKHEGYRMTAYKDSRGIWTIGIGFNLEDPTAAETCTVHGLSLSDLMAGSPISYSDASAVMTDQIYAAILSAKKVIPIFDHLPDDAQAVVIDMIFNMGAEVFGEFKHTINCIKSGDFPGAAEAMRKSEWYEEVGARGVEDCSLMFSAGG